MNKGSETFFRQQGISIVEIMIALLLSLILSAGVVQIYLSNKQTYYLQDEMSRLQENGRFAISVLQRSIRGAGNDLGQVFVNVNSLDGISPSTPYIPANSLVSTSANDQIEITRNAWTDCTGVIISVPPADPVEITEFFYIEQVPNQNRSKNLTCFSGGNAAQLVENVETMEILYGVDEDGDHSADAYRNATQVAAAAEWSNVVSVRIALVLGTSIDDSRSRMSPQPMVFPTAAAHPLLAAFQINQGVPALFDSDGNGLADTNVAQDNRLYRVFTTTIALRNRVF